MGAVLRFFMAVLAAATLTVTTAAAKSGDKDKGAAVYAKRCILCHGEEGDADTDVGERLNPPPRDFTLGEYKIKTSGFEDPVPNDDDLFRMIRDGMPGTAMPGWGDMLSEQDMWDLVAYLKVFAEIEEPPENQVDYGTQVASSPESIEKGNKLFHDGERCSECHGADGKGDAIKKLKTAEGIRTWPRNLTKPWTYRASADPKDVFARITTGIPGTEMPSFANPKSKKKLSIEERWHVANYVASLAETGKVARAENTVIKAEKIDGDLPTSPDDPAWEQGAPTTFFLVPQIIAKDRFFTPSNDTVTVRALYNDTRVAIHMEWDDRTKSIPGDPDAEKIADEDMGEDMISVQLPVTIPKGMEKPYFGMGDVAKPVNLWQWTSGSADKPPSVRAANAQGFGKVEPRDAAAVGVTAKGAYSKGTWRVVMQRPLAASDAEKDIHFVEGEFIPIAFAAWDGSNGETGTKHTLTTWYWLQLKPSTGMRPLITALVVMALIIAGQLLWARSASANRPDEAGGEAQG